MSERPIRIDYFSDVLCVWAYAAQIRVDELKARFGAQIELVQHFIPVFGDTRHKIADAWGERGGAAAFGAHVRSVCAEFSHVEVHPEIWTRDIPASSASAHLFLKAAEQLQTAAPPSPGLQATVQDDTLVEAVTRELRLAFFRDLRDIARRDVQLEIAARVGLPAAPLLDALDSGRAMAELCADLELRDRYRVEGSPTYVLNEGRQKLYGNVGYRIIEANIEELLRRPTGQASWC